MRFEWSDEQRQLQEMVRRLVAERHDFEARRRRIRDGDGGAMWSALAELGLLGLPFAETDGGIAGSMLDMALVMEAFGRGLVVEPYLSTVVLAGGILRRLPASARRDEWIARIIAGELRVALAHAESAGRYNPVWCETTARKVDGGFRIDGAKAMVAGGERADLLLVLARSDGAAGDEAGLDLFAVPRGAPGLHARPVRNIDGTGAAELAFADLRVAATDRLGPDGQAAAILRPALAEATVAACAQAVGAMAAVNEKTLRYALERKAFGQEIARFQAVQHKLVDMRVSEEQASAIMLKAAQALALGRADAPATVAAAKYLVNEEGRAIARQAVQLHGAIGITDELDISHYFRSIFAISLQLGDSNEQLSQYIAAKTAGEHA